MRRAPTFLRARRRAKQRLILRRIGLGALGLVALVVVARLVPGEDSTPTGNADQVAFTGEHHAEGFPGAPGSSAANSAAKSIRALLDQWYQRAFADPELYGDGSFPELAPLFVGEAALGFIEDRESLTIGDLRDRISRIRISEDDADITVFAESGEIRYATAAVRFVGLAELVDAEDPVEITQTVNLVLEFRSEAGWVVTNYYDVVQNRESKPRP